MLSRDPGFYAYTPAYTLHAIRDAAVREPGRRVCVVSFDLDDLKQLNSATGETLDSGYREKAEADRCAEELRALGWDAVVRNVATLEHDLPLEHALYQRKDAFEAGRWCVYVRGKTNEAAGEGG